MDGSGIPKKPMKLVKGFTSVNAIFLRYDWTIKNFEINGKMNREYFDSPTFSDSEDSVYQGFLRIYPKGYKQENNGWISLFLRLKSHLHFKPVEVNFYFCVMDEKQNEVNKIQHQHLFPDTSSGIGFCNFIQIKDLKKYLHNDSLTIRCSFTAGITIQNMQNQLVEIQNFETEKKVLDDFEKLFYNKELSDVTIITQDKEFQTHKTVLAAHSPVFLAMFKNDMQEKLESKVELKDIDSHVLQEFLRFMYCGKIENLSNLAKDLFALADKYDVQALKVKCAEHFSANLNVDNAIEVIIFADLYNVDTLKKTAVEFFAIHAKELTKKDEFKSIASLQPNTILEITMAMAQR